MRTTIFVLFALFLNVPTYANQSPPPDATPSKQILPLNPDIYGNDSAGTKPDIGSWVTPDSDKTVGSWTTFDNTKVLDQPTLTLSSHIVERCYPIIFSFADNTNKPKGQPDAAPKEAFILNADGTVYVDWPRLKQMKKFYTNKWSTVGDFQAWAIINAVLQNRNQLKEVTREKADEIAHLAGHRGDCMVNSASDLTYWPLTSMDAKTHLAPKSDSSDKLFIKSSDPSK